MAKASNLPTADSIVKVGRRLKTAALNRDRRLAENQTGKRRVVVIMRERGGRTLPFVFKSEDASVVTIARTAAPGSTVYADEASHWDALHARFLTKRINHSEAYSTDEACTNQAESFFSRLRRAEIGIHHHVAGPYLSADASEMAWRENNRRVSNGQQYLMTTKRGARFRGSGKGIGSARLLPAPLPSSFVSTPNVGVIGDLRFNERA